MIDFSQHMLVFSSSTEALIKASFTTTHYACEQFVSHCLFVFASLLIWVWLFIPYRLL